MAKESRIAKALEQRDIPTKVFQDLAAEIRERTEKGLIDSNLEPIKCEVCGSNNLHDKIVDTINHQAVEKTKVCSDCGAQLGDWSYGSWMP